MDLIDDNERRVQAFKLWSLSGHDAEHGTRLRDFDSVTEQLSHAAQLRVHLNHTLCRAEHDARLVTGSGDSKGFAAFRAEHKFVQG